MQILLKQFDEIIPDNESLFFSYLVGTIEAIDELSHLQITKKGKSYQFRIAPSLPSYNSILIKELTEFHSYFGIHVDFSKSIKSSGTLSFDITLD